MNNQKKEKKFIDLPEYPGGKQAFREYIQKNLRYPKEALEKGIEGAVYVKYRVDGLGNVVHAEVTHPLGYGCDEEALRLIRSLKYGKAKNRGVRVTSTVRTRINFRLPKPPAVEYSYVATPKKKEKAAPQEKKSNSGESYSYTINF
jgi:TonB family protein